ncbi:Glycine cleavage system H protein [bioreactor metagenome]|uniref:Glycine cleavage system H protein n=1 Tax=bioreactor metagenome TaxID=1076179 RepID=A0A645BL29_9ZZZZ
MHFPKELRYSKTHEWVRQEGDRVFVGLTDYAQSQLGDLVFVNLPAEGDAVLPGETMGDVESVKAVSDVYSPVGGTVAAVNSELEDSPQLINEAPYEAWLIQVEEAAGLEELLTAEEYEAFVAGL